VQLDKDYRSLQAEAALHGVRVERVLGYTCRWTYIAIRGGRCIDCADLAAVRAALVRLGVRP